MTNRIRDSIKLTINWTAFLKDSLEPPKTVDEAVNRLVAVLDDEHKQAISTMQKNDLIDLHFSLGIEIRNAFGLHDQDSPLRNVSVQQLTGIQRIRKNYILVYT